jgi:hypothetical protein
MNFGRQSCLDFMSGGGDHGDTVDQGGVILVAHGVRHRWIGTTDRGRRARTSCCIRRKESQ